MECDMVHLLALVQVEIYSDQECVKNKRTSRGKFILLYSELEGMRKHFQSDSTRPPPYHLP